MFNPRFLLRYPKSTFNGITLSPLLGRRVVSFQFRSSGTKLKGYPPSCNALAIRSLFYAFLNSILDEGILCPGMCPGKDGESGRLGTWYRLIHLIDEVTEPKTSTLFFLLVSYLFYIFVSKIAQCSPRPHSLVIYDLSSFVTTRPHHHLFLQ